MKRIFRKYNRTANFIPHKFSPEIELLEAPPNILLAREAYEKIRHYVDIAGEEVGWLGLADEDYEGYLISDVFLFRQNVSPAATELSEDGISEFVSELLSRPDGSALYGRIRFWGHSHVRMETTPSAQDDAQMNFFAESGHDFFIRGIFNKLGKASFSVYRYDVGVKMSDVPWELYEPRGTNLRAAIEAEFKEKVSALQISRIPQTETEAQYGFSASVINSGTGEAQTQKDRCRRRRRDRVVRLLGIGENRDGRDPRVGR